MKETLNGRDDWLAKELKRERRVSVWDLDKIQGKPDTVHDARDLANEHHQEHHDRKTRHQKTNSTSDPFFILDLILFSLLLPFNVGIQGQSLLPVYVLFCFLLPGLLMWEFLLHRFPPTWYFILALILAAILEAASIVGLL